MGKLGLVGLLCCAWACTVQAQEGAHVHGQMHMNIAVDQQLLTVQLELPLESALGFEHRPRTPAQKQAAAKLLTQMQAGSLLRPNSQAQCSLQKATVNAPILQGGAHATGQHAAEHADLDVEYEYQCQSTGQLQQIELGLFEAFTHLQKIEVQISHSKGQAKQSLRRPQQRVSLPK